MTKNDTGERIELAHGSGGQTARRLLDRVLLPALGVEPGDAELDSAPIPGGTAGRLVTTMDGFVVQPLDFPGGSIGTLAACGTLNDLAVAGAKPLCLSCSLILEEGLALADLTRWLADLRREAEAVGVRVVAGDTKVVRRGEADGLYITTGGVGEVGPEWRLSPRHLQEGDAILVSGTLGDHGAAVLSAQESWSIEGRFLSDCRALWPLVDRLRAQAGSIRFMRDPTRGGLAAVLHELAETSHHRITVEETALPVLENVRSFCEILGLDPLHLAGEGCLVLVADSGEADSIIESMRNHPAGKNAARVGEVGGAGNPGVTIRGPFGGSRSLEDPTGEPLPRIC